MISVIDYEMDISCRNYLSVDSVFEQLVVRNLVLIRISFFPPCSIVASYIAEYVL